jgi:hypothetical protein
MLSALSSSGGLSFADFGAPMFYLRLDGVTNLASAGKFFVVSSLNG